MSNKSSNILNTILTEWQQKDIRYVRFEIPDLHGTSRSKVVPIDSSESYAVKGLNMYGGTVVLDSSSDVVHGSLYNEEVGYADQYIYPDASTAAVVPWANNTARFICDPYWKDGKPLMAAPRHVLRHVLEECNKSGLHIIMGFEYEFYLLDPQTRAPLFRGKHIFNTIRNTWTPVIEKIMTAMNGFGIQIITANCEYAGSQWEINFKPAIGMDAADQAFGFKTGVKEIARQENLLASFMSKPFSDGAGCGGHFHLSLVDEFGENIMKNPDYPSGLSEISQQFIAGLLAHAHSSDALVAPTINCLKRRRPHTFSPTNISWGIEDRSALIRVKESPHGDPHIEVRSPSALANPYLVASGVIASGLIGVREHYELGPPAQSPAEGDTSQPLLSLSLAESLVALERDDKLKSLLGEEFVRAYVVVRQHELERFWNHITDWELQEYLDIY
jgi:glutamine synthetase